MAGAAFDLAAFARANKALNTTLPFLEGSSEPLDTLGQDGQLYFRHNGEVYARVAGAWQSISNLTGERGLPGPGGGVAPFEATQPYALGDTVLRLHKIYQSRVNDNEGNFPEDDTGANWIDLSLYASPFYGELNPTTGRFTEWPFTFTQLMANYTPRPGSRIWLSGSGSFNFGNGALSLLTTDVLEYRSGSWSKALVTGTGGSTDSYNKAEIDAMIQAIYERGVGAIYYDETNSAWPEANTNPFQTLNWFDRMGGEAGHPPADENNVFDTHKSLPQPVTDITVIDAAFGGAFSETVTLPATVQSGDVLLALATANGRADDGAADFSVTGVSGLSRIINANPDGLGPSLGAFWKRLDGSEGGATLTFATKKTSDANADDGTDSPGYIILRNVGNVRPGTPIIHEDYSVREIDILSPNVTVNKTLVLGIFGVGKREFVHSVVPSADWKNELESTQNFRYLLALSQSVDIDEGKNLKLTFGGDQAATGSYIYVEPVS